MKPLRDVREEPERASRFRAELLRGVSPGHVLHGLDVEVIAQAIAQDDFLVETATGESAKVALFSLAGAPPRPHPEQRQANVHPPCPGARAEPSWRNFRPVSVLIGLARS